MLLFGDLFNPNVKRRNLHPFWNCIDVRRTLRKSMCQNHRATAGHDEGDGTGNQLIQAI